MENNRYPFVNLALPCAYDALEPFIDETTMRLHHTRHLQTYIQNLNALLIDRPQLQKLTLQQLIIASQRYPDELGVPLLSNAGGVYNHRFFFDGLRPAQAQKPRGSLSSALTQRFGSFEGFRDAFKKAALSVFGSGYAFLVLGPKGLEIIKAPNQNSPVQLMLCPIIAIDVWEHAYYLKHYNMRSDYIDAWFNVADWDKAGENYDRCIQNRGYMR